MQNQHNSQNPHNQEPERHRDRYLIDLVLEGQSDEQKTKILQIIQHTGVEPDDPMFLSLLVVTQCQIAVTPLPEQFERFQQDLGDFKATAYDLRLAADRVANLLRERTSQGPKNFISLGVFLRYCLGSFLAGAFVATLVALVILMASNQPFTLPPVSTLFSAFSFDESQDHSLHPTIDANPPILP
ncbi:MAG: hypothetical protein HC833_20985 [Leptolyngbyaceae cyanobacterium RM1_406_9]|nr:hypothetical protein [Leptolyngbyaceae cyanobacterium RM1_406_9]